MGVNAFAPILNYLMKILMQGPETSINFLLPATFPVNVMK